MKPFSKIARRSFLAGAASIGGGLSLGFHIPWGETEALANDTPTRNQCLGRYQAG
jgi:hypothetical protein